MANVGFTNFMSLFPQDQMSLQALQQKQAMAQALMQQGSTPIDPVQMAGRYVVPISPISGAAKLASSLLGAKMLKDTNQQQAQLAQQQQAKMASLFGVPGGSPLGSSNNNSAASPWQNPDAPVNASDVGVAKEMPAMAAAGLQGGGGAPNGGGMMPPMQGGGQGGGQGGPLTMPGMTPQQAMIMSQVAPDQYYAALVKNYEPTDQTKRDREIGYTTQEALNAQRAKALKEGSFDVAAGNTLILPNGQRVVGADFKSGVAGGYDANGRPIASLIAGAPQAAAAMAGATTAAQQANTIFTNQNVNGVGGVPVTGALIQAYSNSLMNGKGGPGGAPNQSPPQTAPNQGPQIAPSGQGGGLNSPQGGPVTLNNGNASPQGNGPNNQQGTPLKFGQTDIEKTVIPATQNVANEDFLKNSYRPIVDAGAAAKANLAKIQALDNLDISGKTGWGTDSKAKAANILTGLGIASEDAKKYAADAQVFNGVLQQQVWGLLGQQKGPQTEGDAQRARDTFAQLGNTPEANNFIKDLAKATNNLQIKQANFYQERYPDAMKGGDLTRIENDWTKNAPSVWDDPALKKWQKSTGGAPAVSIQPPQTAVQMLRNNPNLAAKFDAKYGHGASSRYLRQ